MLDESPKSATGYLALVDGTIYASPTEAPIAGGVVLIQDEKIAAVARRTQVQVPSTAQVLDCSGGTITAGFWNNHVHFFERKWANAAEIPAAMSIHCINMPPKPDSGHGHTVRVYQRV